MSFVTSTISGLTILVSGVWRSGSTSSAVVAEAFNSAMPTVGGWILAFCVFLFGYTTLIGWAYYGEQFLEYVCGTRVTRGLPLDLLRAHRAGRDQQGRDGVGLGRPHERAAGVPEPRRPGRRCRASPAAILRDRDRQPPRRMSGFAREEGVLLLRRRVPRGRGPRVRHAALPLQRRRGPRRLPRIRPRVRARAAPDLLRAEGERHRRHPAPAGGPRRRRRHRVRRRAARPRCVRASLPTASCSPASARRTRSWRRGLDAGIGEFNAESEDEVRRLSALARRARVPGAHHAAREPRHRPAVAPVHLDRAAPEQVRRRHRGGAGDPGPAARRCRASRSRACRATSAPRSPTWRRWPRRRASSRSCRGGCSTTGSRCGRSTSAAGSGSSYEGNPVPRPQALAGRRAARRSRACRSRCCSSRAARWSRPRASC